MRQSDNGGGDVGGGGKGVTRAPGYTGSAGDTTTTTSWIPGWQHLIPQGETRTDCARGV